MSAEEKAAALDIVRQYARVKEHLALIEDLAVAARVMLEEITPETAKSKRKLAGEMKELMLVHYHVHASPLMSSLHGSIGVHMANRAIASVSGSAYREMLDVMRARVDGLLSDVANRLQRAA
jgi:hypothetical protein